MALRGGRKAHRFWTFLWRLLTQNTGIIVGAMTFEENVYDGHTLDVVLKQTQTLTGNYPKTATVDGAKEPKKSRVPQLYDHLSH